MPSLPGVQTELVLMQQAAQDFRNTKNQLEAEAAQFVKMFLTMENEWKGRAGLAFQMISGSFGNNMTLLHNALDTLGVLLNQTGVTLEDSDTQAHKYLENVELGTPGAITGQGSASGVDGYVLDSDSSGIKSGLRQA